MTTYKTGNPLGSAAAKDLFDNAQNLDVALNSITQAIWQDRLGKNRKSLWGVEQEFSAQLLSQEQRFNLFIQNSGYEVIGDYTESPLTITEYNQLIRYEGEFWKLTAATDIPFTTSGIDAAAWENDSAHFISVGDAALRQQITDLDSLEKYPELHKPSWVDVGDPRGWGAKGDGSTDDTAAFELLEQSVTGRIINLAGKSYVVTKSFTGNRYENGAFILGGADKIGIGDLMRRDKVAPLVRSGQRKMYSLRNKLIRTEGAGGLYAVIQGCAYDEVNEKVFTLSSTSEYGFCINTFEANSTGELGNYDRTRSTLLGHQGLGLHHEQDGTPVLWTSTPYAAGAANQCVSFEGILNYTGTTNGVTAGFTTWQLFPASEESASSTPTVSVCQNYLIGKKVSTDLTQCTIRVFDLHKMWNNKATNTDYSNDYLSEFTYTRPSTENSYVQGIACDGSYIYVLEAYTYTGFNNYIYVFDLAGRLVDIVDITTLGDTEAIADNTSSPVYKEPESLTVVKDGSGYVLSIGICTYIGVEANGKNVYIFDIGQAASTWRSSKGFSVSCDGLSSSANPDYSFGVLNDSGKYNWRVWPTRLGILTNQDNSPVYVSASSLYGGVNFSSAGSEGQSNSIHSRHSNDAEGPRIIGLKSRSGVIDSTKFGAVQSGDRLLRIVAAGDTGTSTKESAHINIVAAAAPVSGSIPTSIYFQTTNLTGTEANRWFIYADGTLQPGAAATYSVGSNTYPVDNIYSQNAVTVISDGNYKTDEQDIPDALIDAVGSVPLKMWKLKSAVAEKGEDKARYHFGVIAQQVKEAITAAGLDWKQYGLITYEEKSIAVVKSEEGNYSPVNPENAIIPTNEYGYIDLVEGADIISEAEGGGITLTRSTYMMRMDEFEIIRMAYIEKRISSFI